MSKTTTIKVFQKDHQRLTTRKKKSGASHAFTVSMAIDALEREETNSPKKSQK